MLVLHLKCILQNQILQDFLSMSSAVCLKVTNLLSTTFVETTAKVKFNNVFDYLLTIVSIRKANEIVFPPAYKKDISY